MAVLYMYLVAFLFWLLCKQNKIWCQKQHTCCIFIFICVLFCTFTKFQTIINNRAISFCTQDWRGTKNCNQTKWVKHQLFHTRTADIHVDIKVSRPQYRWCWNWGNMKNHFYIFPSDRCLNSLHAKYFFTSALILNSTIVL